MVEGNSEQQELRAHILAYARAHVRARCVCVCMYFKFTVYLHQDLPTARCVTVLGWAQALQLSSTKRRPSGPSASRSHLQDPGAEWLPGEKDFNGDPKQKAYLYTYTWSIRPRQVQLYSYHV